MKKLESSLKSMLLVLTEVTAISVALLAHVSELTKGPIAEVNAKTLSEASKEVSPEFTSNPVIECDTTFNEEDGKKIVGFIVYLTKNGNQWVGTAAETESTGFSGELKILAGFGAEGEIYNYSLLSHTETPGFGSKAANWFREGNRGSIKGVNPGEQLLMVGKDGEQVDAITTPTITSCAFLSTMNAAYGAYKGSSDTNGVTGTSQKVASVQEFEATTVDSVIIR